MRIFEIIKEGGWDSVETQSTELKPAIVIVALDVVDQFVLDFNNFNRSKDIPEIQRGRPTGSTAYYKIDAIENPNKIYGDIDLQMIAPIKPGMTNAQFVSFWNNLTDDFAKSGKVNYILTSVSKPGHPTLQIGKKQFVQVDFMWHPIELADWGAARVTPERGVKGLLTGNMYSVLGELLDMSIQHAGVQLKVADGQRVSFSKQKNVELITVTINPKTFIYDIFQYEAQQILGQKSANLDDLLRQYPGNDITDVKISKLVNGVKGLANSFEQNKMFGKGNLARFSNAADFLNKFLTRYEEKANIDINAAKRDKAETPEAKARAAEDRKKVQQGLDMVKSLF